MDTKSEYVRLIGEVDGILGFLRQGWMTVKASEKAEWMKRIDSALDERLRLMKLRDEAKA